MKRSTDRILTTHVGSLPRPADLLELLRRQDRAEPIDANALAARVTSAVAEQVAAGVDIVGRERVIARVDCGLGTYAGRRVVFPSVVASKFQALAEGARLASEALWP